VNREVFIHEKAIVESEQIGSGTKIWAFSHILPGAVIGKDCNICDQTFIENKVVVGDRVTIKCGVQLWDGVILEDDVFVGPNATFINDIFPRSRKHENKEYPNTIVKQGASIGANATLLAGITIGENSMVGAGSVVTKSVPPNAIVVGNPARISGYVQTGEKPTERILSSSLPESPGIVKTNVKNVQIHRLPTVADLRGMLSFGEIEKQIPFAVKRYFLIYGVPTKEIRGEHAHRACHQFLICVHGSVQALFDDGKNRQEILLDSPDIGLYQPPMIWGTQYRYSTDAVLLVFTSHGYDGADYIREYEEFLREVSTEH